MKFFDRTERQFVEFGDLFIEQYANVYYYPKNRKIDQPLIKNLSRCSHYPEEEIDKILKTGIKNEEDVIHILAWKIGKIAHKACNKETPFVYSSDWADLENYNKWACSCSTIKLRKNQFPIKEIAEFVSNPDNLNNWEKDIQQNNWFNVLKNFDDVKKQKNWKGLGMVYCITLLYFISKGKYPIFDQFADKALDSIFSKDSDLFTNADDNEYKALPSDLPTTEKKVKEFKDRYDNYCNRIEKLKTNLSYNYCDEKNRDLDRALWVYGHIKCTEDVKK